LRPGASLTVQAIAADSLFVQVGEKQISLARTLANSITVEPEDMDS
jgi:Fe2+ transport system protein FeoA